MYQNYVAKIPKEFSLSENFIEFQNDKVTSAQVYFYYFLQGCQPYTFAPCEHHIHGPKPDCPNTVLPTPKCLKTCSNPSINYEDDLIKGGDAYELTPGNRTQMQIEIMKNGPIAGWMILYEDFFYYQSGNTYCLLIIHSFGITELLLFGIEF